MSWLRSASVTPRVGIGLPNTIFTVPERTRRLPFGVMRCEPDTVIGMIGTCDSIARWNGPLLKARRLPSGLRVPSGKMITLAPPRMRAAALRRLATARSRLPRSMMIWPVVTRHQPKIGIFTSSFLATKRQETGGGSASMMAAMSTRLWWFDMNTTGACVGTFSSPSGTTRIP